MNELLFFIQIILLTGFTLIAGQWSLGAATTCIVVQALLANLFVLKQITLFGFHVTASDAFSVGSLLGLSLLQKRFGRIEAERVTWICFFQLLFFTALSQLHLLYTPNAYDESHDAYSLLLSPSPRLLCASMVSFFIVQRVSILLSTLFSTLSSSLRTVAILIICQTLDTALFSFLGLYGIVASMIDIIVVSLALKFLIISCSTPIIKLAKI